jgi:transglutaminase-like putative cysteine protease
VTPNNLEEYLSANEAVDSDHPAVIGLAKELSNALDGDEAIAKKCFEYVRDEISHSGDIESDQATYRASEVLEHKTGWCYAKSHLLCALLRANGIPAGLCYQRLSQGDSGAPYCLHGLNAVYLKEYGWYRVDPRGNKEGIDAQFTPPIEKLAFDIQDANEGDFERIFVEPLKEVAEALQCNVDYKSMVQNFPDRILYKEERR